MRNYLDSIEKNASTEVSTISSGILTLTTVYCLALHLTYREESDAFIIYKFR